MPMPQRTAPAPVGGANNTEQRVRSYSVHFNPADGKATIQVVIEHGSEVAGKWKGRHRTVHRQGGVTQAEVDAIGTGAFALEDSGTAKVRG